jgi:hypothetical protein
MLRTPFRPGRAKSKVARRYRPNLERLEDWVLPSVFTVTSAADTATGGTLRQAITTANSTTGLDIKFNISGSGVHTINLLSALPIITAAVIIDGTSQPGYAGTPLIQLDGTSAGSSTTGLWITGGSSTVKGLAISHFGSDGINLQTNGNNLIQADYIGTDATGTVAEGNTDTGLDIFGGSSSNQIVQNVISANGKPGNFAGVFISDAGTNNNVLTGNVIGLDATGTVALGNGGVGVFVAGGAQSTRIGTNGDGVNDAAERNLISANGFDGIDISGSGTTKNIVAGNYVGTDKTGAVSLANGSNGIVVSGGAQSNRIGTNGSDVNAAGEGNLISGNTFTGVFIGDAGTNSNVVAGNLIGTDVTGTKALGNASGGIDIASGAQSNVIGTNGDGVGDALERNVISGNNNSGIAGIFISDMGTNKNIVAGNYVGTDITGTKALPNGGVGVYLANGAQSNRIGTDGMSVDDAGERNVISGNPFQGVAIQGTGTNSNIVAGNYIGVDASGSTALGNQNNGIWILQGAQSNRIGTNGTDSDVAGEANVIGGNVFSGIRISDPGSNLNLVAGNFIGTDKTGTLALANGSDGIMVANGAQSNQIGGSITLANVIAFNTQAGVAVTDTGSIDNSIRANSIFNNAGIGIDLAAPGVQADHIGATVGPNNLQNYPVITSAVPGSTTSVGGTLNAAANTTYTLDFYANPAHDVTYYGPGHRYLGSTTVTTDANGNVSFSATIPAASSTAEWVTATATDPAGNTSEFSGDRQLPFSSPSLSATTWTAIGPAPVAQSPDFTGPVMSGRTVYGIADPANSNVMYLEADGGGVWKTSDWQDPSPIWTPLTDTQPSTFTGYYTYQGMAIFPGSPETIYALAQGPGGGVLKSTNGGSTWTLLGTSIFDQFELGSIAIDPTNANVLYVSALFGPNANSGGIYKSTNGGTTWINVTSSIHTGGATDVVMDPTNSAVLYAGLVQDFSHPSTDGIYKSIDGGSTWSLLSNGDLSGAAVGYGIRLAIAPSNHTTIYATIFDPALGNAPVGLPHRYLSTNSGALWTPLAPLPTGEDNRYGHLVLTVDLNNAAIIYVNGDHTVYQSTNSGASWTLLNNVEDPNAGFFDDSGKFVLVGDHGIYQTGATASTFINKQGNLQTNEFYTLTINPNSPSIIYGIAQDQFAPVEYNGYPAWTALSVVSNSATDGTGETGKILATPGNPGRLYEYTPANSGSFLFRSDDGGASWVDKGTGIDTSLAGFGLAYASQKSLIMDPNNPIRLVLATNKVYETTNAGDTWTAISPVLSPSSNVSDQYVVRLAIAPSAPNTIYAATADGRLFVTTNNGGSWTEIDGGLPKDRFDQIGAIQVDPANANHAFIAATAGFNSIFGPLHIWQTANGGTTWTVVPLSLASDQYLSDLVVDWRFSTPVLYAGSERGVYVSTNLGSSWSIYGTGMPNTQVLDMELQPGQNLLAVATYGRGVFEILVPGAGPHFQVSAPSTATAGASFSITVTALDGSNNTLTGYTGTVHFTSSDGSATLPADYTFTAGDHGVHTFTGLSLRTAGSQSITATDTVTSSITGAANVTVNPAAASALTVSGFVSPTTAGAAHSLTVVAKDSFGNTVTGYTGTVHFTSSDGQAVLPTNYTFTSGDHGAHTFSATLKTVGTQSITATDTVTSSITGTQSGITVNPGATAKFVVTGFPSPTIAGVAGSLTVTAEDAFGNLTSGYAGTVHWTSSDRAAVLPANYTFLAADAGKHTFSATLKTAGTQSVTVTDTHTSSVKGSQTGIVIKAAATSQLAVSGFPSPVVAGTPGSFTVTAKDAFGNKTTGYLGTVHFTSSDTKAVLPANYTFVAGDNGVHTFSNGATLFTAGSKTITATDTLTSTITGKQTVTVNPAATKTLSVSGFTSPTVAGVSHTFTVTAKDAFGNVATSYLGTVHFTSSDLQALLPANYTFVAGDKGKHVFSATLKTAGHQSITATDTVTSSFTGTQSGIVVNPAAASTLVVSGFPQTIVHGTAAAFTVTAQDAFGNIATGYRGTVHFTSSDGAATLPANYTFTASNAGVQTFSATLKTAGTQSITATDTITTSITGTESGIMVTGATLEELNRGAGPDPDDGEAIQDLGSKDERATVVAEMAVLGGRSEAVDGWTPARVDVEASLPREDVVTALFSQSDQVPALAEDGQWVLALMAAALHAESLRVRAAQQRSGVSSRSRFSRPSRARSAAE